MGKSFISLSGWRLIQLVCTVAISFFMMPFLIARLGTHNYGLWTLLTTFSAYYGMMDFGLSTATQRYIAQAIGKKDDLQINEIVSCALVSYSFLSLIVLVVACPLYFSLPYIFKWPDHDMIVFQRCYIIMLAGMVMSFPLRSFTGMLGAALRQDLSAKIDIIHVVVRSVGVVVMIVNGFGLISISIVTVCSDLLYYFLICTKVRSIYSRLEIRRSYLNLKTVKMIFTYSVFSFVNKISEMLKYRMDNLLISLFLSVSSVTVFSVAFRLYDYFNELVVQAIGYSDALFSRFDGSGENGKLLSTFSMFSRASTVISTFIGLSLILYGKQFISCWVGIDLLESYKILPFLVVPGILNASLDPVKKLYFATSNHHILAGISIFEGAANVCLSIILVRSYGLIGIALGTAIPSMLVNFFIVPTYGCLIIKQSLIKFWSYNILFPAFITSGFVLIYFNFAKSNISESYFSILMWGGIQSLLFLPVIYLFILKKRERHKTLSGIYKLFRVEYNAKY